MKKIIVIIVGAFWCLLCIANLRVTLPFWKDNISLWTWGYLRAPDAPTAYMNLQAAYLANDQLKKALDLSLTIKSKNGGQMPAGLHRGYLVALSRSGQAVEAELPQAAEGVEREFPAQAAGAEAAGARNYMGWMYMSVGDVDKAEHWFKYTLIADPQYSPAVYGLSVLYEATGREDEGREFQKRWMRETHPQLRASIESEYPALIESYRDLIRKRRERALSRSR